MPDEPRVTPGARLRTLKDACAPFLPAWDEAAWRGLMADFGLDPAAKADSLSLGRPGQQPERLKALPAFFDASGLEISQHFTTSKDGTRIPYFQVAPKGMVLDGSHPTLLTGYGGFEVSELPYYSGGMGRAWLSGGGVHPGHARKMFARMQEMGHDVLYFENTEGGHGSGADNRQSAHFNALAFTFLYTTLK